MSPPDEFTPDHDAVAERDALRRVNGLSSELTDVTEVEYRQVRLERVVLAGVWTSGTRAEADRSMRELARLAETAGSVVLDGVIQRRSAADPATYIGSGRAGQLRAIVAALGADTVIVDGELSPGQLRSLEEVTGVKVVDRTWLILDIFAQHARSREGKSQVALAQLQYLVPRLRGWGDALSRQAGGIGTRGPGETKIETDRRRIRRQMSKLRRDIAAMSTARDVGRSERHGSGLPAVAIVGYTNAGKSSLLNRLTNAHVLVHDELFATLDPTVRLCKLPGGRQFTLTDTVGFVSHLPHQLVEAFRSTMEEVASADLLLHVVDGSSADALIEIRCVRDVLAQVGAEDLPELLVINKIDVADDDVVSAILAHSADAVCVSARTGVGLKELMAGIDRKLPTPPIMMSVTVALDRGDLVARIRREGDVKSISYLADGIEISALVGLDLAAQLRDAAAIRQSG